jgi:hypothetical protein
MKLDILGIEGFHLRARPPGQLEPVADAFVLSCAA